MVSLYIQILSPLIFLLCWILIAFKIRYLPIGRTGGTLMCACLMVLFRVLTPEQAFAAVSLSTLSLLFGSMIMSYLLEREGLFVIVQHMLCAGIPAESEYAAHHLLARVCLFTGALSALVTNDTCCVVLTPLLMGLVQRHSLPAGPFLLALATSANIGSACSPVGNPQNMLIASASGLSFARFLQKLLLPSLLGLALNIGLLCAMYNQQLKGKKIVWTNAVMERVERKNDQHSTAVETNDAATTTMISPKEDDQLLEEKQERRTHRPADEQKETNHTAVEMSPIVPPRIHEDPQYEFAAPPSIQEAESTSSTDEISSEHPLDSTSSSDLPSSQHISGTILNLSDPWSRREYIRREQLSVFYGVEVDVEHGTAGHSTTAIAREVDVKLVYVTPKRYQVAIEHLDLEAPSSAAAGHLRMIPPDYADLRSPIPRDTLSSSSPSSSSTPSILTRLLSYRRRITKLQIFSFILFLTILSFFSGLALAWCALCGACLMLVCDGVDPDSETPSSGGDGTIWSHVDWSLLIFFSALFIVVEGFHASQFPEQAWNAMGVLKLDTFMGVLIYTLLIVVGSNTVSNVPLVLILSPSLQKLDDDSAWLLLAFVSTIAGNLTLVGSVANLIVAQRARKWYDLTFMEYLKYGFPSTIVLLVIGVAIIQVI